MLKILVFDIQKLQNAYFIVTTLNLIGLEYFFFFAGLYINPYTFSYIHFIIKIIYTFCVEDLYLSHHCHNKSLHVKSFLHTDEVNLVIHLTH